MKTIIPKHSFFAAAIGTMIEYYDYALFSIFLPIIAPLFFPADTIYQSLVKGYFVLLITMVARPLGGIFFGYIGDRFGRRKALLASIYGIAIATVLIGLTPSYQTIGMFATILIITAKAIQIFCFGGEFNGAGIYVVEHAKNKNEGLIASLLTASTLFGSLIASFIGIIVTLHFMPNWSWRLAFILGGIIGYLGIISRKNLMESPGFEQINMRQYGTLDLIKHYPKELVAGIFIGGLATVPFTTVLIFINPVKMANGYFTSHQLMWIQTFLFLIAVITLIPAGILADKKSPKNIMQWSCLALIIFSYPLLWLVDHGNLMMMLIAVTIIVILNEFFLAPVHAYFKNLFPMHYRYRGSSLGFCLGMSLLGGLTPIINSYLYDMTGHFSAISIWILFVSLGAYFSIWLVSR